MIKKVEMYVVVCDNCNKECDDDDHCIIAWVTKYRREWLPMMQDGFVMAIRTIVLIAMVMMMTIILY